MITAIVTSDNHLGAYYARLRPERLEARRRALQRSFERVVDAAIERRADLFLHAGDLFDRPDPRNAERYFVARQVRRLRDAGIPIFVVAGNHDSPRSWGYDGAILPHEEMDALGAIHLFRGTDKLQAETISINGQRVGVWGMSCDFNRPDDVCPLQDSHASHERGGDVDIVLLHYGVEGWAQPFAQEPCLSLENLGRLQTDAICVGHLHKRAETRLPSGAALLNPGATEHIHFGEEHLDCGFWILRLEPGRVETEYVPLPAQPMSTLQVELSPEWADVVSKEDETTQNDENRNEEGPHPMMMRVLSQIEESSNPEQMLRVRLSGRLPRAHFQHLDLAALQVRGSERNFHCQLDTERLTVYDEYADVRLGYGVSFDAREELQNTAHALAAGCGDDTEQAEIFRLAGEATTTAYEQLTGSAR
jgi:exonuclease SbcD